MSPTREQWLQQLVEKATSGEHLDVCVDWPWALDSEGYAYASFDNKMKRVSHASLIQTGLLRPDPPNNHALHSCDRPKCVAPWHLRWGSNAENGREAYARGLREPAGVALLRGEAVGHAKLSDAGVRDIRIRHANGLATQGQLAREYGVAQVTISKAIKRITWRHVD